ncbi:hypothetical protein ACB092_11G130400 [Castanea dentata]
MGSKEMVVLFMLLSYLYTFATSSPLQKALPSSDSLPETHLGAKVAHRHDSSYIGNSGRSAIKHSRKFEHAAGGGSAGAGESGHNGGSSSPAQGGRNFIPVYVAGAANNRQNHHRGSANCNQYSIGISTLVAVTVGSLIANFYLLK